MDNQEKGGKSCFAYTYQQFGWAKKVYRSMCMNMYSVCLHYMFLSALISHTAAAFSYILNNARYTYWSSFDPNYCPQCLMCQSSCVLWRDNTAHADHIFTNQVIFIQRIPGGPEVATQSGRLYMKVTTSVRQNSIRIQNCCYTWDLKPCRMSFFHSPCMETLMVW